MNVSGMIDTLNAAQAVHGFGNADLDGAPAWLAEIRQGAAARAGEMGFPTTRHEEWRFTNVAPALQTPWRISEAPGRNLTEREIAPLTFGLDGYRLVFIDGHFCEPLSIAPPTTESLRVGSLKAEIAAGLPELEKHLTRYAPHEGNVFTALNTAFFQDGGCVWVGAGAVIERPIHLLFVSAASEAGATAHPRNLIIVERGGAVKIVESYASLGNAPNVTNAVTELAIEAEAQVEHCKVQTESERAFHFATIQARQGGGSRWTSHSIAIGGRIARNQIQSLLNGEGAACTLNGLYLGRGEQLLDHHTVVDHARPRCESHEFYHGILGGRAHGVFNGKIFVRPHAQKTNAKQTNRNLLLSEEAVIDTKPQLEIFADDVKCTHGATIGQMDEEAIFYLRSRGIGLDHARRMLIRAFASGVVERIGMEPVRAQLDRMLNERFANAG